MKEIVLDSFKNSLIELEFLNNLIEKEKTSKEELKKGLKQAQNLLFSSYSSFSIFEEAVTNYVSSGYRFVFLEKTQKKKISKTEVKLIYNQLVNLIKLNTSKGLIELKEELKLDNQIIFLAEIFNSAAINEDVKKLNETLNITVLSKAELLNVLKLYINSIVKYIQDILLYDIFFIFDKPKVDYKNEIIFKTDYKKKYIDKWLDCSVTLSELRRNKRTDHWAEIYKLKLKFEEIEKIENHQKKLFNECIETEIRSTINDFDELEGDVKKEALIKEIKLIQDFFNSDTSKTVVKRLKNILSFSKPKEVILEYDNILRDRLLLSDFNVYEVGKSNYSSAFVASFFMQYLDKLKEYLESLNDEVNTNKMINNQFQYNDFKDLLLVEELEKCVAIEKPKTKTKSKHQSFTYINNLMGQSNLTGLKDSLIRRKLIASDTDLKDFRKVFSGEIIEKPITWTGNISELSYFIKQLHNELKLVKNLKQQQWAVTTICFIQEDGKPFERSKFRGQKVPATSKNIDSALNTLK